MRPRPRGYLITVHEDEAAAVIAATHGDRAAFAVLVAHHEARLRHFVARIVGPAEADDVAQDAFVKAWLSIKRYRAESSFGAWLFGIAWRAALDHRRAANRSDRRNQAWHLDREDAVIHRGTAGIEIERALATLTDEERAALVLTAGHGWSHGEAAAILGLPLGTLKSIVVRAKSKARAAIEGSTQSCEERAA